jgi:hypothetical protein
MEEAAMTTIRLDFTDPQLRMINAALARYEADDHDAFDKYRPDVMARTRRKVWDAMAGTDDDLRNDSGGPAEMLAAALLVSGVSADECDALDEWLRNGWRQRTPTTRTERML